MPAKPVFVDIFRLFFTYSVSMFNLPDAGTYPFVVDCKVCHRNFPAPKGTMPDTWIVAECPLCGAKRRYLPAGIFQGRLSTELLMRLRRRRNGGET